MIFTAMGFLMNTKLSKFGFHFAEQVTNHFWKILIEH